MSLYFLYLVSIYKYVSLSGIKSHSVLFLGVCFVEVYIYGNNDLSTI